MKFVLGLSWTIGIPVSMPFVGAINCSCSCHNSHYVAPLPPCPEQPISHQMIALMITKDQDNLAIQLKMKVT